MSGEESPAILYGISTRQINKKGILLCSLRRCVQSVNTDMLNTVKKQVLNITARNLLPELPSRVSASLTELALLPICVIQIFWMLICAVHFVADLYAVIE